jgi:DNA-binding response OmpR family regulator
MRILLADDDRDQLTVRSMLLERNGFETLEAMDRNSAVEIAAAQKPECAVIDLRFPTEEIGLRLIRELKSIDSNMHLFVLTGGDPEKFARRPERKLVDHVVVKGSSFSNLLQRLRTLAVEASHKRAKASHSGT